MKGNLLRTLRALLLSLKPESYDVGYHSNPDGERAFFGNHHDGYRVTFEGADYFVKFNYTDCEDQFQILVGHARGRDRSGNTADLSFTEEHFGIHQLLVVSPSLRRCNGRLSTEPTPIGNFPARVSGTSNRFVAGFPDTAVFPCLFRLCLAKKESIERANGQP